MAETKDLRRSAIDTVARRFVERIGFLDSSDLEPLLHRDFVFRTMMRSSTLPLASVTPRSDFLRFLGGARVIFPRLCPHRVVGTVIDGDHVVVESECEALFDDGRVYANAFSFHLIFDGELIVEIREYTDFLHTAETVFAAGAPPTSAN